MAVRRRRSDRTRKIRQHPDDLLAQARRHRRAGLRLLRDRVARSDDVVDRALLARDGAHGIAELGQRIEGALHLGLGAGARDGEAELVRAIGDAEHLPHEGGARRRREMPSHMRGGACRLREMPSHMRGGACHLREALATT
eukprot:4152024-Prymnesium_polylepis.1